MTWRYGGQWSVIHHRRTSISLTCLCAWAISKWSVCITRSMFYDECSSAPNGQWSVDSGRWSVISGQRAVVSDLWSAIGDRCTSTGPPDHENQMFAVTSQMNPGNPAIIT